MAKQKKTKEVKTKLPPRSSNIENYTNGEAVIRTILDFAKLHSVDPKEISIEIEKEYGYYDEVDCAIIMTAPRKEIKTS